MKFDNNENANIIHLNVYIDEKYLIHSADENFYKYAGTTTKNISDSIHQVDIDDFLYVIEHFEATDIKNLVLRFKKFDNSYRWVHMTIEKIHSDNNNSIRYKVGISDIINLNNHYMALTRAFNHNIKKYEYDELMPGQELFDIARKYIDKYPDEQTILVLFNIKAENNSNLTDEQINSKEFLDAAATEFIDFIADRGYLAKYDDNRFLIMVRNIGSEINVRSFIKAVLNRISWMIYSKYDTAVAITQAGLAEYPRNGHNFDKIVDKLHRAYERSVQKGNSCYIIYKEELHGEI